MGNTVSVDLDGKAAAQHSFDANAVAGGFGLLAKDGSSAFHDVTVSTNDPAHEPEDGAREVKAGPVAEEDGVSGATNVPAGSPGNDEGDISESNSLDVLHLTSDPGADQITIHAGSEGLPAVPDDLVDAYAGGGMIAGALCVGLVRGRKHRASRDMSQSRNAAVAVRLFDEQDGSFRAVPAGDDDGLRVVDDIPGWIIKRSGEPAPSAGRIRWH